MSVVATSLRNRIQMWSEKFFKHGNNPTYACLTACQTDTSSHPHQKIQHKKKVLFHILTQQNVDKHQHRELL